MKYITKPEDVYNSPEFKSVKKRLIHERVNHNGELLCEMCGKPILSSYDTICHHIEELTHTNMNDPEIALNPANLQLVHRRCHDEHHKRFGFFKQKVILVHGSPLSGKSSYVKQLATKDDIVMDMDSIWQMISVNERYIKPNRLREPVFAVREAILDVIKLRHGQWFNAYIIVTMPRVLERKRFCDRLGVEEIIHIDTDKETCINRLYENPNGRNIADYQKYIEEYFLNYQE